MYVFFLQQIFDKKKTLVIQWLPVLQEFLRFFFVHYNTFSLYITVFQEIQLVL